MDTIETNSQGMWDSRFSKRIFAYGKLLNAFFTQELIKSARRVRNAVHALTKRMECYCIRSK